MTRRSDFDRLMRAVCVGYGYCGSLQDDGFVHVTDLIPERGRVTAEQFVDWLFIADGEQWTRGPSAMLRREKLRSCFVGYMGSDVVDAHRLRYSRRLGLFGSPLANLSARGCRQTTAKRELLEGVDQIQRYREERRAYWAKQAAKNKRPQSPVRRKSASKTKIEF